MKIVWNGTGIKVGVGGGGDGDGVTRRRRNNGRIDIQMMIFVLGRRRKGDVFFKEWVLFQFLLMVCNFVHKYTHV